MYKIYIDTTERYKKKVSLKEVTDAGEAIISQKEGEIDVVSTIKDLLEEAKLQVSDIDEVIPNKGPGSFTGLKVGVTIANLINWFNKKKSIKELDMPEYGAEPNIQQKKF